MPPYFFFFCFFLFFLSLSFFFFLLSRHLAFLLSASLFMYEEGQVKRVSARHANENVIVFRLSSLRAHRFFFFFQSTSFFFFLYCFYSFFPLFFFLLKCHYLLADCYIYMRCNWEAAAALRSVFLFSFFFGCSGNSFHFSLLSPHHWKLRKLFFFFPPFSRRILRKRLASFFFLFS